MARGHGRREREHLVEAIVERVEREAVRSDEARKSARVVGGAADDVSRELVVRHRPRAAPEKERQLGGEIGLAIVHRSRAHEQHATAATQLGERGVPARARRTKSVCFVDDEKTR